SFIEELNKTKETLHDEISNMDDEKDDIEVKIALQYNQGYTTSFLTYDNNIYTHEGRTHEDDFKRALTKVINSYATKQNIIKAADERLSGEDVREGLTAIVSIKHTDPQFEGQTKTK